LEAFSDKAKLESFFGQRFDMFREGAIGQMGGLSSEAGSHWLRRVVDANRNGGNTGLFSVCSAHPRVLAAAMRQALHDDSVLSVESTSSQVNQFGGYTGLTPPQFVTYLRSIAQQVGLPPGRILIGGDHLGPYPWRAEPSERALTHACTLVRSCVLAGYEKIHLDASMSCIDDPELLDDKTIARRAALLCSAAEDARAELPIQSSLPLYVIGTEVPVPGGEESGATEPQATSVECVHRTLDSFRSAFVARGLQDAWQRVIGLVVQSGAEFGDARVFDYVPRKTRPLREHLPESPSLVYEAHSTDYQTSDALKRMVHDHFAILKVGPWLTFAFREAIFALAAIEREWLGGRAEVQCSSVREALESAMLRNPVHWRAYYQQDVTSQAFSLQFSYSDRVRYYWSDAKVQIELDLLLSNLAAKGIPLTLISQYFPEQYNGIRTGELGCNPDDLIEQHIGKVLRMYSGACENLSSANLEI
jgi:D-tagatose-1,6-bisphosphate aldolase subunit GatZ/KbaZ